MFASIFVIVWVIIGKQTFKKHFKQQNTPTAEYEV